MGQTGTGCGGKFFLLSFSSNDIWVQEIANSGPLALGTYEAVADILVRSPCNELCSWSHDLHLIRVVGG